jgi:hypothetical protein
MSVRAGAVGRLPGRRSGVFAGMKTAWMQAVRAVTQPPDLFLR